MKDYFFIFIPTTIPIIMPIPVNIARFSRPNATQIAVPKPMPIAIPSDI